MRVLLGANRREAINRFQERLGPVTPRPLAEQTFQTYVKRGLIVEENGQYLIEDTVSSADMRGEAKASIAAGQDARSRSKGNVRHFSVTSTNFHRARIANSWSAVMAQVFAPTLFQAQGKRMPNKPLDDPE